MNYFEYKGIRSWDLGIRIQEKEVFSGPKYDLGLEEIPGRDGDLIRTGGRFPNVQVTYSVFVAAKSISELSAKLNAIKAWLYTDLDRYHQLSDTYNPGFTRKGVFAGELDIEDELNKIGVFTISFSCLPFQYSEDGGETWEKLPKGTIVSMNLWGFTPDVFGEIENDFNDFLANEDLSKAEFYIPTVVDNLIKRGKAKVKVLKNTDKWYGMTYKEDKKEVTEAIAKLIAEGAYDGIGG